MKVRLSPTADLVFSALMSTDPRTFLPPRPVELRCVYSSFPMYNGPEPRPELTPNKLQFRRKS